MLSWTISDTTLLYIQHSVLWQYSCSFSRDLISMTKIGFLDPGMFCCNGTRMGCCFGGVFGLGFHNKSAWCKPSNA